MCGSMKIKGKPTRIGTPITARLGGTEVSGRWSGFARQESIETTWRNRIRDVMIDADSYEEHGVEFKVPEGKAIRGAIVDNPFRDEPGQIVIVTRPAETDLEIQVHNRHPVFVPKG